MGCRIDDRSVSQPPFRRGQYRLIVNRLHPPLYLLPYRLGNPEISGCKPRGATWPYTKQLLYPRRIGQHKVASLNVSLDRFWFRLHGLPIPSREGGCFLPTTTFGLLHCPAYSKQFFGPVRRDCDKPRVGWAYRFPPWLRIAWPLLDIARLYGGRRARSLL